MAEIKDGGPAFPQTSPYSVAINPEGMSLRDYFAAKALQGFCAQAHHGPDDWTALGHGYGEDACNELNKNSRVLASCLADWAYALADEMLRAREAK